jgi:hypothetical protein
VVNQLNFRLSQNKELVKAKICGEADYCKNRNGEGLNIVVTTMDGFLSSILGYPIPAFTVLVWLVKTGWLDRLCECP